MEYEHISQFLDYLESLTPINRFFRYRYQTIGTVILFPMAVAFVAYLIYTVIHIAFLTPDRYDYKSSLASAERGRRSFKMFTLFLILSYAIFLAFIMYLYTKFGQL